MDHVTGALAVGDHLLQQLLEQRDIDAPMFKKTAGSGGVVRQSGKRLSKFMSEGGSHFAHQGDSISMSHFLALMLQSKIGLSLGADVQSNANCLHNRRFCGSAMPESASPR